jgi:hypothetical protein
MRTTSARAATAIGILTLVTACGDARLDKLSLGVTKDSAAAIIGETPHRAVSYVTAGKVWEVQFYPRNPAGDADSIPWRKMSPVVFIENKAVGWGWGWWGRESIRQNIVMPK